MYVKLTMQYLLVIVTIMLAACIFTMGCAHITPAEAVDIMSTVFHLMT